MVLDKIQEYVMIIGSYLEWEPYASYPVTEDVACVIALALGAVSMVMIVAIVEMLVVNVFD